MSNEEKILKYLSDSLNADEKKKFESEIESSQELKKEYLKFREALSELKKNSAPQVDEKYFINLTPRMREKLKAGKKVSSVSKYVLAFSATAAVIVVLFTGIQKDNSRILFSLENEKSVLNEALEETTNDQLGDYLNISFNYGDENFSVFSEDMDFDTENLRNLSENTLKTFNEFELIEKLSEEEADEIYNQLLNTKIL